MNFPNKALTKSKSILIPHSWAPLMTSRGLGQGCASGPGKTGHGEGVGLCRHTILHTYRRGLRHWRKKSYFLKTRFVHIISPWTLSSFPSFTLKKRFTTYPFLRQISQDLTTPPSGFHFSLLNSFWHSYLPGSMCVSILQRLCVCVCVSLYSGVLGNSLSLYS